MSDPSPSADALVPLATFAATLKPRVTGTRTAMPRNAKAGAVPHTINVYAAGSPDEIWLKWLTIQHGVERHTLADWQALIDQYRDQPAHPSVLT